MLVLLFFYIWPFLAACFLLSITLCRKSAHFQLFCKKYFNGCLREKILILLWTVLTELKKMFSQSTIIKAFADQSEVSALPAG